MNSEKTLVIRFTMPVPVQTLFDFIIIPKNMELYDGFLLSPGIAHVDSRDLVRKVGTIDKITNTDGSSHEARTDIFEPNKRYTLTLSKIQLHGYKKMLANIVTGFREDWFFFPEENYTRIERRLIIVYEKGFFNSLVITLFIAPQLYFSLLKHHQNVLRALSHD